MGLFDNIFLDKDTPTALLNNPEVKAPEGEKKPEEAKAPYDPKNDPIAPATEGATPTGVGGAAADVSFDIGGDIDFSSLGGDGTVAPATEGTPGSEVATADTVAVEAAQADATSSIAMVQGGTASAIENIDIGGGIDGIKVDIPGETALPGAETSSESTTGAVDIQIHDIEEHHDEAGTLDTAGENTGILDMLGGSESTVTEEATTPVGTTEVISETPETSITNIANDTPSLLDTAGTLSLVDTPAAIETPVSDISLGFDLPTSEEVHTSGRIAELIAKLIEELKKLDEEEKAAHKDREAKIQDVEARTKSLDEEYATRKKALEYERSSIDIPLERTAEKERIKSLISGFEKDLDTV